MEAIQAQGAEVLVNIALAVVSLLGACGVYLVNKAATHLRTKTDMVKSEDFRTRFTNAVDDVEKLAAITVGAIEQTTASSLREAVKGGKANREELLALGATAFQEIKSAIAPELQFVIATQLGSFDSYLRNLIESKVLELKTATGLVFGEAIGLDAEALR